MWPSNFKTIVTEIITKQTTANQGLPVLHLLLNLITMLFSCSSSVILGHQVLNPQRTEMLHH